MFPENFVNCQMDDPLKDTSYTSLIVFVNFLTAS